MVRCNLILFSILCILIVLGVGIFEPAVYAGSLPITQCKLQLRNNRITVWKIIVAPGHQHRLQFHGHNHDCLLIALTDGILKVVNNQKKTYRAYFRKDTVYYLTKDRPDILHAEENIGIYPFKYLFIELRN